ncbi:UNVERIFIED_CONTAM: hypothetical protein Scaly_3053000 [Sesamum calycinum]|uniref:Retrotransposon gag domain-containing protein n=1 Tax=Sesamum calycinum TaxID=2727403 RepID=A0AAW2K2N6_9LAMI
MEARLRQVEELVGKPEQPPTMGLIQQVLAVEEAVENLKKKVKEEFPQFVEKGLVSMSEEIGCLPDVVDIKLEALKMDISTNRERIETWEVLKEELKDQFIPFNKSWVAREFLRNLRYTGTVPEFVKEFSSFMLDVRDMSEEDKLFNFMADKAKFGKKFKKKEKAKEVVTETSEPRAIEKPMLGCFICGNLEQQLGTLQVQSRGCGEAHHKGLMMVTGQINSKEMKALVDMGVTNNFISDRVVQGLGLDVKLWDNQVNAVNSKAVLACTLDSAASDDGRQHKPYVGVGRWTVGLYWYHDMGLVNDTWQATCIDGLASMRTRLSVVVKAWWLVAWAKAWSMCGACDEADKDDNRPST